MEKLVQIIYVSRSSVNATANFTGIEPKIARILAKSRLNNRKNGLVGVLYFGDGCFFQCLEGSEVEIDKLYDKLLQDPRHNSLKLISRKQITHLSFTNWAIKYVPLENKLNAELKAAGYNKFDPYEFDAVMTAKVLKLLQSSSNEDSEDISIQATKTASIAKPKNYLSIFVLFVSILFIAILTFSFSRGNL